MCVKCELVAVLFSYFKRRAAPLSMYRSDKFLIISIESLYSKICPFAHVFVCPYEVIRFYISKQFKVPNLLVFVLTLKSAHNTVF